MPHTIMFNTTRRTRHIVYDGPHHERRKTRRGDNVSDAIAAQHGARWRLVDHDAAVLPGTGGGAGCLAYAVQPDRQPGERSRQHRVWPYAGEHLHLLAAARGNERHFRADGCLDPRWVVLDPLDMAATAPDHLGPDLARHRWRWDDPGRAKSGERQRVAPPHWRVEHPGRKRRDDLAGTGHMALSRRTPDRASPC